MEDRGWVITQVKGNNTHQCVGFGLTVMFFGKRLKELIGLLILTLRNKFFYLLLGSLPIVCYVSLVCADKRRQEEIAGDKVNVNSHDENANSRIVTSEGVCFDQIAVNSLLFTAI